MRGTTLFFKAFVNYPLNRESRSQRHLWIYSYLISAICLNFPCSVSGLRSGQGLSGASGVTRKDLTFVLKRKIGQSIWNHCHPQCVPLSWWTLQLKKTFVSLQQDPHPCCQVPHVREKALVLCGFFSFLAHWWVDRMLVVVFKMWFCVLTCCILRRKMSPLHIAFFPGKLVWPG